MSEDTSTEEVVVEQAESEETDSTLTLEDALKALKKTRQEAAKHRTEKNALKEKADAHDAYLDSQKTELQRLADAKAAADAEIATLKREKLRDKVVRDAKLDPDLAELVDGATEAEMKAKAKILVDKFGEHIPPSKQTDFFAGRRGLAVTPQREDAVSDGQAFFKQLWDESDQKSTKTVF